MTRRINCDCSPHRARQEGVLIVNKKDTCASTTCPRLRKPMVSASRRCAHCVTLPRMPRTKTCGNWSSGWHRSQSAQLVYQLESRLYADLNWRLNSPIDISLVISGGTARIVCCGSRQQYAIFIKKSDLFAWFYSEDYNALLMTYLGTLGRYVPVLQAAFPGDVMVTGTEDCH